MLRFFIGGAVVLILIGAIIGAKAVADNGTDHVRAQSGPTATPTPDTSKAPTQAPTTAPTPTNTPAPTATAATGNPGVPTPAAGCPTTAQAQKDFGVKMVRTGTEPCTWEYHSAPNVMHFTVKPGYVATITLTGGKNIVTTQGEYDGTDITGRFMAAFPVGDPARDNPCGLLAKEQFFGQIEDPSFKVEAGPGLNCTGANTGLPSGTGNLDPKLQAVIRAYCVGDCSGMVLNQLVEANGSVNPLGAKVAFNGKCYTLNIPDKVTWDDDKGAHSGPASNVQVCEASLRLKN